jgi:hypothetical protein
MTRWRIREMARARRPISRTLGFEEGGGANPKARRE